MKKLELSEVVYDLSPDAVAKFAMVEELRLVTTKIDGLVAYVDGRVLLPEEVTQLVKILDASRIAIMLHEREKSKKKCAKKKNAQAKANRSPLAKPVKPSLSLWGRLKRFLTASLHPLEDYVD